MYEKPEVEVVKFESEGFMTWSPTNNQNSEMDAKAAAAAAMGWGRYDGITAQKGADGKWMAYCTLVNGKPYSAGEVTCTKF